MQALRRELNFMEAEALKFAAALETASETNCDPTKLTAQLEGRFRFLWGIYRAHSEVPSANTSSAILVELSHLIHPWYSVCKALFAANFHEQAGILQTVDTSCKL